MYLLDTNACIALIKGEPASVRQRFEREIDSGTSILVSSVIAFELWYGVAKSARREINQALVQKFLAGRVGLLALDFEHARFAGEIRAMLEASGKPIGAYDVLIAGQALCHDFIVVTANVKEFSRIKGLRWEDWANL